MTLPAVWLEELRERTPMVALVGRRVHLVRSGRQQKGCCPFHHEKTPSFYVYDDHYHCFGCGVHGDCISFVMETLSCDFVAAVRQLAAEVGLEVPHDEATAATREQQQTIAAVLEIAQRWFATWLREPQGAAARAYLVGRGISDDTVLTWGLGWSGPGRGALADRMEVPISQMIEAGLMTRREDDGVATDLFWNRLMFPIHDQAGKVISFGGRVLGDTQPKYVNGPETAIYSKRRTLYGMHKARDGLMDGCRLVVVEGYLDAISMHAAGEGAAVAPLGTALTPEQLNELWRLSPAPVLLFDGDAAGDRAALHVLELGLAKLDASRTLRIGRMPAGKDPDSLIREGGAEAIRAVVQEAALLEDALFEMLRHDSPGPLGRAIHRNRLTAAADSIADAATARAFRHTVLNRFFDEAPACPSC